MKSIINFIIVIIIFVSCDNTVKIRENNQEDIDLGLMALTKYYEYEKKGDYSALYKEFHYAKDDQLAEQNRRQVQKLYGELESCETYEGRSKRVINGQDTTYTFRFLSTCKHVTGETYEDIEFHIYKGSVYYQRNHIDIVVKPDSI